MTMTEFLLLLIAAILFAVLFELWQLSNRARKAQEELERAERRKQADERAGRLTR